MGGDGRWAKGTMIRVLVLFGPSCDPVSLEISDWIDWIGLGLKGKKALGTVLGAASG